MKKFDNLLNKHPLYYLLFFVVLAFTFKMLLNMLQHQPLLSDMGTVFFLVGFYFASWIIAKLTHSLYLRGFLAFVISMTYLTVEMFFDGSYVDDTSLVVTSGVAIFIAAMMCLIMYSIDKEG